MIELSSDLCSVAPPSIITTAPTSETLEIQKRKSTFSLGRRHKSPGPKKSLKSLDQDRKSQNDVSATPSRVTFDEPRRLRAAASGSAPPPYGDESSSALALPITRLSESSRSDGSSGDHGVFATTTTTHTVSTTTTFFKLHRRKKDKGPLFPLPPRVTGERSSESPTRSVTNMPPETAHNGSSKLGQSPAIGALASSSISFATSGAGVPRSSSRGSTRSARSGVPPGRHSNVERRGRSSTLSSLRRALEEDPMPTPPFSQSTRTSTSTAGRPSLGTLFNLSRLRQSSEPMFRNGLQPGTPGTPASIDSKKPSFHIPRAPSIVLPERQEGDTPAKYLARLEEIIDRGAMVALLSKSDDEFTKNVMRSYMRTFKLFEDPLDMAVRKMLMQVDLPKETQHIDRTLQSFADRYHECNPGIFASPGKFVHPSRILPMLIDADDAYFVAFSILILHTDVFNKNNKHKMQKADYVKNAKSQGGVPAEVLECFYDNIAYTPFIHVEDFIDTSSDKKSGRKGGLKMAGSKNKGIGSGPVDPYTLILEGRLDSLRPPLDEILIFEDPFQYLGTAGSINLGELHTTFFKTGVIQIVSSRSRPEAFANPTIVNPTETQVGVVDMKVTKVGILWRKDPKKKKARSPWQEWGAILTGSQLYFFRNTSWVKNLMHQHETHQKIGRSGTPVIFKPPLEQFKPDFLVSTEDAVALVDSGYKKHKHAFLYTRQNIFQEVFLADNDADMNDWLAKLNYAAAFRTAGVRMRGVIGGSYDARRSRETQRAESRSSAQSIKGATREAPVRQTRLDDELAKQVMLARRQILTQKIKEADERITASDKNIDGLLRASRQMSVLAPIQTRTKDDVVIAALNLAHNVRWCRIAHWKMKCHRDILALDLEEDIQLHSSRPSSSHKAKGEGLSKEGSKSGFGRKHGSASGPSGSKSRPANHPTGSKLFSMDEIFRTPSRLKGQHKSKGSWELPPLSFDRGRSVSPAPDRQLQESDRSGATASDDGPAEVSPSEKRVPSRAVSELIIRPEEAEKDEHEILVEAGLFSPDSQTSESSKLNDLESEDDKIKLPDMEDKEAKSKVRHSLQRKLQMAHVPSHRSKKARDSSGTSVTEDSASLTESEGLARTTGSFTVHGKKASVVQFGSEWQNMSPEDRSKFRRSTNPDESQSIIASSIDGAPSDRNMSLIIRPMSAMSDGNTTITSLGGNFHTPAEMSSPGFELDSLSKEEMKDEEGEQKDKHKPVENGHSVALEQAAA